MNIITIVIGFCFFGYGVFSGIMRVKHPGYFKKLEPMKRAYGEKAGNIVHFIGYVVIPVVFGIILMVSGITGKKIF